MPTLSPDWVALTADHDDAVSEYCAALGRLPRPRWAEPLAPGKWSAAEVTSHLVESYQLLRTELAGGAGMRVVVPPVRRWLLRLLVLPRILRSGRFPPGARAPRETRPGRVHPAPDQAVAELRRHAEAFSREITERAQLGPVRLSHAYFGALDATQAMRLCGVHTRHHARQVAAAAG